MEAERLEAMAAALEATGRYRVYRQLQPSLPTHSPDGIASKTGLFIDVETTGLDPQRHEITPSFVCLSVCLSTALRT